MAAATTCISFSILLFLLSTLFQSLSSHATADQHPFPNPSHRSLLGMQRTTRQQQNQIPNCSQLVSRSQCFQKPKCRWCKSEALDDMCFTKAEAWRLPQQVFLCD